MPSPNLAGGLPVNKPRAGAKTPPRQGLKRKGTHDTQNDARRDQGMARKRREVIGAGPHPPGTTPPRCAPPPGPPYLPANRPPRAGPPPPPPPPPPPTVPR